MVVSNWDAPRASGDTASFSPDRHPSCSRKRYAGAIDNTEQLPPAQRILFLKSWNEWAEGNYVEPDRRHGDAYLRAVAAAVYGHGIAAQPADRVTDG